MIGFDVVMLDAMAHATVSVTPPAIERSVSSFISKDIADAAQKDLAAGETRLAKLIADGAAVRTRINAEKPQVSSADLPLVDRVIAVADMRLKERAKFFERERKLVPRYRKFIESHFPDQLTLYDGLEVGWDRLRKAEHDEIVDFLCFLRVVRNEIDRDGRAVVATFDSPRSWRKYAERLIS